MLRPRLTRLNRTPQAPIYIAHRGLSARFPENTTAAFEAAIAAGAAMIELDVTFSRDRRLAVIHDERVNRTTNGRGPVSAHTMKQLQRLDAGSWFDPAFAGQTIPELADVLDLVNGRIAVNIEIKPEAYESSNRDDAVERQILDLLTERNMLDDVIISSFSWWSLARVRSLSPAVAIGLLSARPADEHLLFWYRRLGGFSWHPDWRLVTAAQVALLHAAGARVFPYIAAGRIDSARLLAMGVDGLIVDDPSQMAAHQRS